MFTHIWSKQHNLCFLLHVLIYVSFIYCFHLWCTQLPLIANGILSITLSCIIDLTLKFAVLEKHKKHLHYRHTKLGIFVYTTATATTIYFSIVQFIIIGIATTIKIQINSYFIILTAFQINFNYHLSYHCHSLSFFICLLVSLNT